MKIRGLVWHRYLKALDWAKLFRSLASKAAWGVVVFDVLSSANEYFSGKKKKKGRQVIAAQPLVTIDVEKGNDENIRVSSTISHVMMDMKYLTNVRFANVGVEMDGTTVKRGSRSILDYLTFSDEDLRIQIVDESELNFRVALKVENQEVGPYESSEDEVWVACPTEILVPSEDGEGTSLHMLLPLQAIRENSIQSRYADEGGYKQLEPFTFKYEKHESRGPIVVHARAIDVENAFGGDRFYIPLEYFKASVILEDRFDVVDEADYTAGLLADYEYGSVIWAKATLVRRGPILEDVTLRNATIVTGIPIEEVKHFRTQIKNTTADTITSAPIAEEFISNSSFLAHLQAGVDEAIMRTQLGTHAALLLRKQKDSLLEQIYNFRFPSFQVVTQNFLADLSPVKGGVLEALYEQLQKYNSKNPNWAFKTPNEPQFIVMASDTTIVIMELEETEKSQKNVREGSSEEIDDEKQVPSEDEINSFYQDELLM